jgi:hypothetical protein
VAAWLPAVLSNPRRATLPNDPEGPLTAGLE